MFVRICLLSVLFMGAFAGPAISGDSGGRHWQLFEAGKAHPARFVLDSLKKYYRLPSIPSPRRR